ncbi:ribonuclease [Altericroceibacterium spongiae]|uniref:Ribonuclease n=1 Tax=Altericroceibacterium spongiae TaxID=2320269 RepID=A0A420EFD0_9SPHN|nr:ribonuclease E/G [Altericroceibacterium spongiae]RKF19411.1 ribonuclease [Altericroceibacterium spongiae]
MTWFVERGIGEQRAIDVRKGHIIATRLLWPDELYAGYIADAQLIARQTGSSRGTVRFANGEEALVDRLPREASEGRTMRFEVTRAAIRETRRSKLAHARLTDKASQTPDLAEQLRKEGIRAEPVHAFPTEGWEEIVSEALEGQIAFPGGALQLSPTPAMTLIDIDGSLRGRELALAAVKPIARALRLFDLGGSIGIDFPTLETKAARKEVDQALEAALSGWLHERTAMNGFGFVQIVTRMTGPSLLHRAEGQRNRLLSRQLLRRAEYITSPGMILLTAHPAVLAHISTNDLTELARRTGREIRCEQSSHLAIEAGFAQSVSL